MIVAETAAREFEVLPLDYALALVYLYADKRDRRFERAALRYFERYLAEANPSLADVAGVAALPAERSRGQIRVRMDPLYGLLECIKCGCVSGARQGQPPSDVQVPGVRPVAELARRTRRPRAAGTSLTRDRRRVEGLEIPSESEIGPQFKRRGVLLRELEWRRAERMQLCAWAAWSTGDTRSIIRAVHRASRGKDGALARRGSTALTIWGIWGLQLAIPLVVFALLASKGRLDEPDWRDQSAGFVGLFWILVMFVGLIAAMRDLRRRAWPGWVGLGIWLLSFGFLWWLISVAQTRGILLGRLEWRRAEGL